MEVKYIIKLYGIMVAIYQSGKRIYFKNSFVISITRQMTFFTCIDSEMI